MKKIYIAATAIGFLLLSASCTKENIGQLKKDAGLNQTKSNVNAGAKTATVANQVGSRGGQGTEKD